MFKESKPIPADRLDAPVAIDSTLVSVVAGIGILINGLTAWLFMRGQRDDVNLRGAFLHMLGDAAISAAVLIGALGVSATGWLRIDPALSLAVSLFVSAQTTLQIETVDATQACLLDCSGGH